MAHTKKDILVFAHWTGLEEPKHMGTLTATPVRGKESFAFEYTAEWLKSGFSQMLDPDLQMYSGAYYPRDDKSNFGVFLDSCPDRWGRVLMQRKETVFKIGVSDNLYLATTRFNLHLFLLFV